MEDAVTSRTQPPPTLKPGKALYQAVRGALVSEGTSLRAECEVRGLEYSHARKALLGQRRSNLAGSICQELATRVGLLEMT